MRFIRQEFGSYFTIGVAGYPIPHPNAPESRDKDIQFLKEKVDSGADFIITQLFFDAFDYFRFRDECQAAGILVPIIPGVCAINNFRSLKRFAELSSVPIPKDLYRKLKSVQDDDETVREIGVQFLTSLCKELLFPFDGEAVPGLHFYTLNQTSVMQVIKNIGLWSTPSMIEHHFRPSVLNNNDPEVDSFPLFWLNIRDVYHHNASPQSIDYIPHPIDTEKLSSIFTSDHLSFSKLFYTFYAGLSQQEPGIPTISGIFHSLAVRKWMEECFERLGRFMRKGLIVLSYIPRIESKNVRQYECIQFLLEKRLSEKFIDESLSAEFLSKHREFWLPVLSYNEEDDEEYSSFAIGRIPSIRQTIDEQTGSWEERLFYEDSDFREAHQHLKSTISSWIEALEESSRDSVTMLKSLSFRHFVMIRSPTEVPLEELFDDLFCNELEP